MNKTWAGVVKSTPPPDKAGQKIQSHTTLAKQCWGIGEIKDFSEVSRKIEQGEEPGGSIALAPSVNHALDLRQLALGHKMNHLKFACVVINGNLSNSSGHATMITLPVNVGQTVKFQRMACVFLGDDKPVLPTNLVQEVATVPAKRALATVRIHVPRNFVSSEHWKLWTKKPAHMLQDWSAQAKPVHASYGWTTTNQKNLHGSEDFVLGYAKIDVSHVQEFLALSGRAGVFVARLVKESTPVHVSWEEKVALNDMEYYNKVLSIAAANKTSVAWRAGGGNNLGCRLLDSKPPHVCGLWRIKNVPGGWNESDLFGVLQEAGWGKLLVVAYPTKKVRPWLVKAKPPEDVKGFCAAVQAGNTLVTMEKTPLGRSSTKIAAKPQKVGVSSHVLSPLVENVVDVDQEGTPSAGIADTQMDEASQEAGSKRPAEAGTPGSAPQARKVLKAEDAVPRRLRFEKFEIKDCGADGACGYNCIAVSAAVMRGMNWDELRPKCGSVGATLRVQVAQQIAKHAKDYRPMWSPDFGDKGTTVEKEDGDIPLSWDSWLNAIRRRKRWICGLTIKAAATRLGIQLIAVLKTPDGGWGTPMAFGVCQKKESPVIIGLDEKAGHYVLLLPDSPGDIPNSWRTAQSGEVTLVNQFTLRGAGGKKDSPQAWLPPSTPRRSAPSGRSDVGSNKGWLPSATPKSVLDKRWLPDSTPSFPRGSVRSKSCPQERELPGSSTDIPDVGRKKGSRVVEPSVSDSVSLKRKHVALSHDRPVGSDQYVWTCGICNVVLRDPLLGKLSQRRMTHVANRHPGQGREAGYIRNEADTVVPRADLPPGQRVWTCAYCDVGLPSLDKWTLEKSKSAHFKSAHPRKKITGTDAAKQLAKRAKKTPALWSKWADKSKAQSQRMKLKYEKTRDLKACGHNLVEVVDVDWESWPGAYNKKVRLFTCSKCWIVCRGGCKNKQYNCRGNTGRTAATQRALWNKLRSTRNREALLKAWGVTATVADERFALCYNPSSPDFGSQGHDWRVVVVATKQVKVRLWTCLRCRVFDKDVAHYGACQGRGRKLRNKHCKKWKIFASQPLIRRELCKVWQIKVAEANKWFRPNSQGWVRNLCEEGLEPNPGPLCAFRVLSCNVNSARGAWSVLDHAETLPSKELWVLALQETKMLEKEQVAFGRACRTRGFRCFHVPGRPCSDRWGQDRALGGCTILVDSRLQARADVGVAGLTSQICGVWVQGWFVGAMYAPPRSNGERRVGTPILISSRLLPCFVWLLHFVENSFACGTASQVHLWLFCGNGCLRMVGSKVRHGNGDLKTCR